MKPDDLELLARYAQGGDERAFTALVHRHVDLVYAVAMRTVRSPHHAEEVSQSVFIDLAKNATRMKPNTILPAWLYRVTHRTAVDLVRRESRHQRREQAAGEFTRGDPSPDPAMEPLLDDAMETLPETDRAAIVLRFFQGKSLHDVGAALGISEDAAQKRVSRAVDHLRAFFTKRGIATGSVGVFALLAANTAKAAPAGLASGICATVSKTMATGTTITLIQGITMTLTQKALIAATVTAVAGFALYEVQHARETQRQAETAENKQRMLASQLASAHRERDTNRVERRPQGEVAPPMNAISSSSAIVASGNLAVEQPGAAGQTEKDITAKAAEISKALSQHPELMIPELKLLTQADWNQAIRMFGGKMDTDDDARSTFALLRMLAKEKVATRLRDALNRYAEANDGQLPAELRQLTPYFTEPLDPAILDRYKLLHDGKLSDVPPNDFLAQEKADPADPGNDSILTIGKDGHSFDPVGKGPSGGGIQAGLQLSGPGGLPAIEGSGIMPAPPTAVPVHPEPSEP